MNMKRLPEEERAWLQGLRPGDVCIVRAHGGPCTPTRDLIGRVTQAEDSYVDINIDDPMISFAHETTIARRDTGFGSGYSSFRENSGAEYTELFQATVDEIVRIRNEEMEAFLEGVFRRKWNARKSRNSYRPDRKELAQWAKDRYMLRRPAAPHLGADWVEVVHKRRPTVVLARKDWMPLMGGR